MNDCQVVRPEPAWAGLWIYDCGLFVLASLLASLLCKAQAWLHWSVIINPSHCIGKDLAPYRINPKWDWCPQESDTKLREGERAQGVPFISSINLHFICVGRWAFSIIVQTFIPTKQIQLSEKAEQRVLAGDFVWLPFGRVAAPWSNCAHPGSTETIDWVMPEVTADCTSGHLTS